VFPGLKLGRPLSNMAMLSVLKDMNCDESGEHRWTDPKSGRSITPHGLRATFRTWGEDAGFPRDLLEESLGHPIGTAVERAYRRTDSIDVERLWRLGPISVVASLVLARVSAIKARTIMFLPARTEIVHAPRRGDPLGVIGVCFTAKAVNHTTRWCAFRSKGGNFTDRHKRRIQRHSFGNSTPQAKNPLVYW
jgi:riboflavin synthase alpha subunit